MNPEAIGSQHAIYFAVSARPPMRRKTSHHTSPSAAMTAKQSKPTREYPISTEAGPAWARALPLGGMSAMVDGHCGEIRPTFQ